MINFDLKIVVTKTIRNIAIWELQKQQVFLGKSMIYQK